MADDGRRGPRTGRLMRRGEIWTVSRLGHPKPRPAVVMSVNAWNTHAPYVILIPLTTKPGPSRPPVKHASLKTASYAKCGSVSAIPKSRLARRIGELDAGVMAGIERELRRLLGV